MNIKYENEKLNKTSSRFVITIEVSAQDNGNPYYMVKDSRGNSLMENTHYLNVLSFLKGYLEPIE